MFGPFRIRHSARTVLDYIRDETLTRANKRLVAAQADTPLARLWGGADVASADGQQFRVPVETLNADYRWKHFGEGKGITYFTFVSDQVAEFLGVCVLVAVSYSKNSGAIRLLETGLQPGDEQQGVNLDN